LFRFQITLIVIKIFSEVVESLLHHSRHRNVIIHTFLSCVSILTRDIDIANLSVCLSVRPSVRYVSVPDEKGLRYRHSFFINHSSFTNIKHFHKITTGSPPAVALNTGGVLKFRDFLLISRYISQTATDTAIVTMEG